MLKTTQPVSRDHLLADVATLIVAAIWGATFFMVKDATATFPVLAFLALRFCLTALVMLPLVLRLRRWPRGSEVRWGILAGAMLTLGYILQTFALRRIESGRTGFITGLYVVLVPFLALVLLRQRLSVRVLGGTLIALAGLVLLSYAPGGELLGDLLAFGCAASYALQIIVVERFPKGADWRVMTVMQVATVGITSAVLLPLFASARGCESGLCTLLQPFADPLPTALPLLVLATALFTGLLASGVGLSVQVWAQRRISPSEAALIYAMESPFAALFSVVFAGELLTERAIFGGVLIVAGVIVTTRQGPKPISAEALAPGIPNQQQEIEHTARS